MPKAAKRPRQSKARKSAVPVAEPAAEDGDAGADGETEDNDEVVEVKKLVSRRILHGARASVCVANEVASYHAAKENNSKIRSGFKFTSLRPCAGLPPVDCSKVPKVNRGSTRRGGGFANSRQCASRRSQYHSASCKKEA